MIKGPRDFLAAGLGASQNPPPGAQLPNVSAEVAPPYLPRSGRAAPGIVLALEKRSLRIFGRMYPHPQAEALREIAPGERRRPLPPARREPTPRPATGYHDNRGLISG